METEIGYPKNVLAQLASVHLATLIKKRPNIPSFIVFLLLWR
jgi:hypothetical protein